MLPKSDRVYFTGSTRAGKRVMQLASDMVKCVSLELGGKSADRLWTTLIFPPPSLTASAGVPRLRPNVLGPHAHGGAAIEAQRDRGPGRRSRCWPHTSGSDYRLESSGTALSAAQQQRVRDYINKGIDEGARIVAGGVTPPEGLERGYYITPTIFSDVRNDMTIAQEEIFGPVLSIIPYDTEEEAIEIANASTYGLAGGVWASTDEKAFEVARKIRTGQVSINGGGFNVIAPFGGYRQSGIGRELGKYGFEEFLEVKAIQHH